MPTLTLRDLWRARNFSPNPNQEQAILHTEGPLYLPAGPGSGKTRVLLWRTVNLIVFHDVKPNDIYLSTFTEKAALQLREGLRQYLGAVTNITGVPYDIGNMYVGTVHSLCQHLIADRRLYPNRERPKTPQLMDDLEQYFFLYNRRRWDALTSVAAFESEPNFAINSYFKKNSNSRHHAVVNAIALFNRLSEERIDPQAARKRALNLTLQKLLVMYEEYLELLASVNAVPLTDFSLLQQNAVKVLEATPEASNVFRHVIIDEYQDTNTIQEQLFFKLAAGHKNLCVVGDDDQALYRFRGATVENFVQFPERCEKYLGIAPRRIELNVNYRSRERIVDFYTRFMDHEDWRVAGKRNKFYRVADKEITAHSKDKGPSVVATTPGKPEDTCEQIALLVRDLIQSGKVNNPNQIAFLFPSLKYDGKMTDQVRRMKEALERVGLEVYAPRAGRFLEVPEAMDVLSLFTQIFGNPEKGEYVSRGLNQFHNWLDTLEARGKELVKADGQLAHYIADLKTEIKQSVTDYALLERVLAKNGWDASIPYDGAIHKRALVSAPGLSEHAKNAISAWYFEKFLDRQRDAGAPPLNLAYILNRATSVDWSVLDLFYRFCGFTHFKAMFDRAEKFGDEGPLANLALLSNYLAQFNDIHGTVITGRRLSDNRFQRQFFVMYLYALYRLSESEYEDAEDPFPKGRIPFLTIHQSKGLEFPVVVLSNPRKDGKLQQLEEIVAPLLDREGEPLDRQADFDVMRMFYVALSRAQNLLVLAHLKGAGQRINKPFQEMLDDGFPRLDKFKLSSVAVAQSKDEDLPKNYSYTADYLLYQKCPRQYMIFRKYDFVPSRSQTMFFGSLVHRTLEDLHQFLISERTRK